MRPLRALLLDVRKGYRDAELAVLRLEVAALKAQLNDDTEETSNG